MIGVLLFIWIVIILVEYEVQSKQKNIKAQGALA